MDTAGKENEREIKQSYLHEHIVLPGFDTQDFLKYLTNIKQSESATDIDSWNFEELKKVGINLQRFRSSMILKMATIRSYTV